MQKWIRRFSSFKDRYNFYSSIAGDKRRFIAKAADYVLASLCITIGFFFFLTMLIKRVIFIYILSMGLFILFLFISYTRMKKAYKTLKINTYKNIESQKIEEFLDNISVDSFRNIIIELLQKSHTFSRLIIEDSWIEAADGNIRYAIAYDVVQDDKMITWENIYKFIQSIEHTHYSHIIICHNGYSDNDISFIKESLNGIEIILLDREYIKDLLMQSNIIMENNDLRKTISKKHEIYKYLTKLNKGISKRYIKIRSLFIYSLAFFALRYIGNKHSMYYTLISFIFLLLAITFSILIAPSSKKD